MPPVDEPLISVITVNLNNVDGLLRTIASVRAQTFSNFEYIVIDGGSTDGSLEVIKPTAMPGTNPNGQRGGA